MVHVRSHSRQRQNVVTVMTLASVSMILPCRMDTLRVALHPQRIVSRAWCCSVI